MTGAERTETTLEARSQTTKKALFSLKQLHGGSSPVPVEILPFISPGMSLSLRLGARGPGTSWDVGHRLQPPCLCHTETRKQWCAGARWRELLVKLSRMLQAEGQRSKILKAATGGVFTPGQLADATDQAFVFSGRAGCERLPAHLSVTGRKS